MFTFASMSTEVSVLAPGPDERSIADRIAELFWRTELRFSRFRADSELSGLNRSRGPTRVSDELFDVLLRAWHYFETSGGLFDPGVGTALIAFGYDRSFTPGGLDRARASSRSRPASYSEVRLDRNDRTVDRPGHVQIDLGGMLKGTTLDLAATYLPSSGVVEAGGDAVFRGSAAEGGPWLVDIEDPRDASRTCATLAIEQGAVATSACNRRRWRLGPGTAHHLIDPRAQAPADPDLAQVTVVAASAERADVLAKIVFLMGAREGRRFIDRQPGVGAVLVRSDGRLIFAGQIDVREVYDD